MGTDVVAGEAAEVGRLDVDGAAAGAVEAERYGLYTLFSQLVRNLKEESEREGEVQKQKGENREFFYRECTYKRKY